MRDTLIIVDPAYVSDAGHHHELNFHITQILKNDFRRIVVLGGKKLNTRRKFGDHVKVLPILDGSFYERTFREISVS